MENIEVESSRILVIDDSKFFLKTISEFLRSNGCNVDAFEDAKQAIKKLRSESFDVILCDYEMPDFDGPEFCSYIKSDEELRKVPLIMLTGHDDQDTFMTAVNAGADDFISKANFNEILIPKIFCMLRLKKLRAELVDMKEVEAVRTLIGTFKHEFNNKLMIMSGSVFKLKNLIDESDDNLKSITKIEDGIKFITDTLRKIGESSDLETQSYDSDGNIYKVR